MPIFMCDSFPGKGCRQSGGKCSRANRLSKRTTTSPTHQARTILGVLPYSLWRRQSCRFVAPNAFLRAPFATSRLPPNPPRQNEPITISSLPLASEVTKDK